MPTIDERQVDTRLLTQVLDEYLDMPGLQLTLAQASRLWNREPSTTLRVLDGLVDKRFLRRVGDCYVRADFGRVCA